MTRTLKPSSALILYILIAIFPGCLCTHLVRIGFVSDRSGTVILGMFIAAVPYVLLSVILVKFSKATGNHQPRPYLIFIIALMFLVAAVISFVSYYAITMDLYHLLNDETSIQGTYSGDAAIFSRHLLAGWAGACFIGFATFFMGIVIRENIR